MIIENSRIARTSNGMLQSGISLPRWLCNLPLVSLKSIRYSRRRINVDHLNRRIRSTISKPSLRMEARSVAFRLIKVHQPGVALVSLRLAALNAESSRVWWFIEPDRLMWVVVILDPTSIFRTEAIHQIILMRLLFAQQKISFVT